MTNRRATYLAKRVEAGWRRVFVWLDPATQLALAALTGAGVSAEEAIRRAVREAAEK